MSSIRSGPSNDPFQKIQKIFHFSVDNPRLFLLYYPLFRAQDRNERLGGIAQLGERLTGSQEVRGSIPLVSTIVNAKAFGIPKAFFHAKTPRAANPTYATKSCTIYFPCLYIVCWTNAITSTPHWSIRASGASTTSASTPISCANVNNIPKQPP